MSRVAITKKASTKKETPKKKLVKHDSKKEVSKTTVSKTTRTKIKTPKSKKNNKSQNNQKSEVVSIESSLNKIEDVEIKATAKKAPFKKTKTNLNEDTVVLPLKINSSILGKIKRYEAQLNEISPQVMYKVTRIGGYSFVFVGLAFCYVALFSNQNNISNVSAVSCGVGSDCLYDTSTTNLQLSTNLEPIIAYDENFNKNPDQDFSIEVDVTNASDLQVVVISKATGKTTGLKNEEIARGQYKIAVPVTLLSPDTYTLFFRATANDGKSKYDFTGPDFTVKTNTQTATVTDVTNNEKEDTDTNLGQNNSVYDEDSVERVEIIKDVPVTTIVTDQTNVTNLSESSSVDGSFSDTTIDSNSVVMISRADKQENGLLLTITSSRANFVEVYARQEMSSVETFLGLARKNNTTWVYQLNDSALPVGTYAILAKTTFDNKTYTSYPITHKVVKSTRQFDEAVKNDNQIQNSIFIEQTKTEVTKSNETPSEISGNTLLEQRDSYYTKVKEGDIETATLEKEEIKNLQTSLVINDELLNDLLKRYASAVQAKNENLIRLAENEINNYKNKLLNDISQSEDYDDKKAVVADRLQKEIENVKAKVVRYENILAVRSNLVSRDSDQDGITDYDEATLYKTDAFNADTDGDGVIDSVEILKGFDPLNPNAEAVVNFRSPLEYNYIDEQNLIINSVIPIINQDSDQTIPRISTEIKGKGLPNSFVTLYVFSSPTIITIKTDRYGNFEYVFTKELEDGEHEVYVAITDNTGEIVARSNPFQFTKTAEAYTVTNREIGQTTSFSIECETADCLKETKISAYNLTAGLATVSFGLILLMIGNTLRLRPEDEDLTEKHDNEA